MAAYSAFFSSGLLAPHISAAPALPPSPMAISTSTVDPVDRQLSLTPTPAGQTNPRPEVSEAKTKAERPPMRRRRSSINVSTSPMALIKSPVRNAGAALQRTGFMSPTRHRATSASTNEACENNSLFGRLRNGVANPSKRLRRAIRRPVPLAPPPSVPLPALPPCLPPPRCGNSLLPPLKLPPGSCDGTFGEGMMEN